MKNSVCQQLEVLWPYEVAGCNRSKNSSKYNFEDNQNWKEVWRKQCGSCWTAFMLNCWKASWRLGLLYKMKILCFFFNCEFLILVSKRKKKRKWTQELKKKTTKSILKAFFYDFQTSMVDSVGNIYNFQHWIKCCWKKDAFTHSDWKV